METCLSILPLATGIIQALYYVRESTFCTCIEMAIDNNSKKFCKKLTNNFFFLSGFSFTNIHESQDSRERRRAFH